MCSAAVAGVRVHTRRRPASRMAINSADPVANIRSSAAKPETADNGSNVRPQGAVGGGLQASSAELAGDDDLRRPASQLAHGVVRHMDLRCPGRPDTSRTRGRNVSVRCTTTSSDRQSTTHDRSASMRVETSTRRSPTRSRKSSSTGTWYGATKLVSSATRIVAILPGLRPAFPRFRVTRVCVGRVCVGRVCVGRVCAGRPVALSRPGPRTS